MRKLEGCEPSRPLYYFEEICRIPHGSGNNEAISSYLVNFAKEHGFAYEQDEFCNVIIYKPGTPGYENSEPVILQGHMDMVCEKRPDIEHDFLKDPLNISVENGFITANGTTLGGDDGIAVAYALAILESTDLPHPPLEVVITVDEEVGLLGATFLDVSNLKATRMINLDSESEDFLWVSCAGGLRGTSVLPVRRVPAEGQKIRVHISGLAGGHSGAEIDKKRANANILLGRLLYELKNRLEYHIIDLEGGTKDNVITRESTAELLIDPDDLTAAETFLAGLQASLRTEYAGSDEGITLSLQDLGCGEAQILHPASREKVLFYMMQIPFGVQKMSGVMDNLVETSLNFGIMKLDAEEFRAGSSIRSSVETAKMAVSDKLKYLTEFLGGEYTTRGIYPAWEYRKESPLRDTMVQVYKELFDKNLEVVAIHAGLECGLFYKKLEGLDCVSIGPNMFDIHTPEERLEIASVERVYRFLLKTLEVLK